jgi:chromosome condensin MukBEF ATPase and DNA-binding subunit MukB
MYFEHAEEYKRRLEETRDELGSVVSDRGRLKTKLTKSERDRDRLVAELKKATALHHLKNDGTCTCGVGHCATMVVAEDPWTRERLGRTRKRPAS